MIKINLKASLLMITVILVLGVVWLFYLYGRGALPKYSFTGSRPADLAIVGAKIYTFDPKNSRAQAAAVKDGRFVYVGDNQKIDDFIGPKTKIIDARGRTITPGFIDNHCHPLWIGGLMALMTKDLFECKNFDEMKAVVLKQSKAHPDFPFVGGIGWKMEYVPGGQPKKEILDEIVSDRPIFLMSYSGNGGWLNSKAISICEKNNPAAFEALVPDRNAKTGKATGYLRHFHAINFLDYYTWEELGVSAQESIMTSITKVLNEALSFGITAANDAQIYQEFVPLLLKFRDRGGLDNIRVRGSLYIGHEDLSNERKLRANLEWWKKIGPKESNPHFVLGDSLKFYIDGTSDTHTSFQLKPFSDKPDSTGDPVWTQEGFDRVIRIVDKMGLQACTHGCGDAGIRRIITSYEKAQKVNGPRDSRHRIEHCTLPTSEDQLRMGRLGIYAAMQPTHFYADPMVEKALGPEHMQRFMPWRSLEKSGVCVSFGSDWCAGPMNPVYGLLIATTRMNYKGKTDWGPEEKITIENAIRHWTIDSAKTLFMDKNIGSIETGKYADCVIFNTDPLSIGSWWFLLTHQIKLGALDDFVDTTFVDGRIVYQKPGSKP